MRAAAEQGRWDEVLAQAQQLLERDPADRVARYWSARAQIERGRPMLGGRRFENDLARTMIARARDLLADLPGEIADGTQDARAWWFYARDLLGDDATLASDLEREYEARGTAYAAELRARLASRALSADAVPWAERAAAAQPERADLQLDLARELGRAGRLDEALAAWERAVRARAELPALLAELLALLPDRSQAARRLALLEALAAAGDEAPVDADLAWHRSWALEQLDRSDEAERQLAHVTEGRRPELERAHARLLEGLGRDAEACTRHERALDADGDAEPLLEFAARLGRRRVWELAERAYEAVLARRPGLLRAELERALTLSLAGRGWEHYARLARAWPGRADVLNDAALAAWGAGDRTAARELLERALTLPDGIDARENLARLLGVESGEDLPRARELLAAVLHEDPRRDRSLHLRCLTRAGRLR